MATMKLSPAARELKREYERNWAAKHRQEKHNAACSYWERKAAKLAAEKAQESAR